MNTNNIQQKHIYNERVQEFFPLFDEIKKEDDLIYNVRVDFNTVKFLTEHADWNWDEDENKNKACGVILQECNKTARQELEDKAKEELNKYITSANNINDDVEDKKVSIYGNHASITLEDNKKEFKISEFLNSDFCQKNGISGFSTLHSDGKSGMHGFVAEEGGKKIRHYVVTDGSYEMTLKWYAKGEECKIKIKIDANGVDLVKGDDFSLERLEANQDVKIGGLFLHEIKFREKGKVNEVQHDGKDNQALNKSSEIAIKSNSRDIEQEVKKPVQKHQATHMNREIGSQTPSLPPLRTTPEKDVFNEQGSGSQKPDRSEQTPNNQQKGATSDPSDSSTFTKSVSHNQDNRQKDERYDNPTFGHAVPGSQKPDRSEQTPNNQQQPKTQQQEGNSKGDLLQDIRNFKRNSLRRTGVVDGSGASMEGGRKNESTSSILETLKDKVPYLPYSNIHEHDSDNRGASDAEWEESKQPLSVPKPNSKSDSGYSPQIHAQPQVDPEQPKRSLENIEQSDQTPPENLLKEIRDRSQQDNRGLRQVDPTDKLSQDKEDGLLKDSSTDVKTNDSGYSPQIHAQPQVDPEQPKRSLENIEQSDQTPPENLLKEIRDRSQQDNRGLRQVDPTDKLSQDKEDGLLKDSSTDVKTNDSGYSPQIHAQPQVDPEQPKRSLENIEQSDQTPPENLLKEIRDRSQQDNRGLRQVDPTDKLSQDKEDGLLKDSSTDVKTNDSGYSSPTHANHGQSQVNPGQLKASLMNVEQRDDTLLTEFTSKLDKETQKFPLKPVDQKGISEQTKEHLLAAGLLKDSSTDVKTNDSGYSSPTHANHGQSQVNPGQLKASLMNVEQRDDTLLTEFTSKLDKETQKFPLKPVDQKGISEQTKEHLLAAGLLKDSSTDVKTNDSGYSPQIHAQPQVDPEQPKRSLENIEQSDQTPPENLLKEIRDRSQQDNRGLRQVDPTDKLSQDKEDGLLKDSSTDAKTNDSGYSSPTHANHGQSQVNPGQLKASLMNVEQRDDTLLTEFISKLDKETQKFPLKPVDQKGISEQTKEHLLAAGLLKDSSTDIKTVAEQENNDTNSIVDKNSNLYKLLEKDEAQLKIGVIEEERKDTLTEHTDSYDRNRIALGNRNKRPLDWTKRIAESQQEKDTNKGISI